MTTNSFFFPWKCKKCKSLYDPSQCSLIILYPKVKSPSFNFLPTVYEPFAKRMKMLTLKSTLLRSCQGDLTVIDKAGSSHHVFGKSNTRILGILFSG